MKRKIKNNIDEFDIAMYVDESMELVKDYCNISEIPLVLKFTIANIACDISNNYMVMNNITGEKAVKSISRGDTSITYVDSIKLNKVDIIRSYFKDLNRYRTLKRC